MPLSSPLSIALFSECYHPMHNGVVVSVSSFARVLSSLGHDVTIFTAQYPGQPVREDHVYRFFSIPMPSRARYPLPLPIAPTPVWEAMESLPLDVIHANAPMVMGHVARTLAQQRHLPLVFTYHTLIEEYVHYLPFPNAMARRWAVRMSREFSNSVDHIIAPSTHVATRLRGYHVVKPITVIPTGIDIDLIDAVPRDDIRGRFAIPPDVPLLVYAGRVAKEKNLPRILGAFREVLGQQPDTHLLIVGGGPFASGIRTLGREYGLEHRIRTTGFVPRETVFQCMKHADIFVFASLTETQGIVVGEAMACGAPVVAVEADATSEVITSGESGLLVPNDDGAFADAVCELLAHPTRRATMAQQARRRAEHLSAQRCTEKLLAVYQEVIAAGHLS